MDAITFHRLWGISHPNQDGGEFASFVNVLEAYDLDVILEIGTEQGGTLLFWEYLLSEKGLLISVDLSPRIRWNVNDSSKRIEVVVGDSQKDDTVNKVKSMLNGRCVDFLFIDANHRYESVKRDYENYHRFVRRGGLIAFHDIALKQNDTVPRFWHELKMENKKEIVSIEERDGYGIGYFTTGD